MAKEWKMFSVAHAGRICSSVYAHWVKISGIISKSIPNVRDKVQVQKNPDCMAWKRSSVNQFFADSERGAFRNADRTMPASPRTRLNGKIAASLRRARGQ